MSLDNFKKPIELARKVIDERYIAYKMDSNVQEGNMRKAVGLGTCHCCDYFLLDDRSIILIEETSLPNLDDATENAEIKSEMQLKAYGSMLILCRLSMVYDSAKKLFRDRKCKFWVVDSNADKLSDERYYDAHRQPLNQALTQVIGTVLLDDVKVLSAEAFKIWLARHAPAP